MVRNTKAVEQRRPKVFGAGSEDIVRVMWGCIGNEAKLADCPRNATMCTGITVRPSAGLHCFGN